MSLFDKKGISLAAGFDYQAEQPLDSRFICSTVSELQQLIDGKATYKGLVTYCLEDSTLYTFNGTTFEKSSKQEEENYADLINRINQLKTDLLGGADTNNNTLKKLADRITSEITRATAAEGTLQTNIDSEKNRAVARENEIEDALEQEVKDRESAISNLSTTLTGSINSVNSSLSQAIEAEANRAQGVESTLSNNINTVSTKLNNHISNKSNPHGVTKDQVELGSVVNAGQTSNPTQNSNLYFTAGGAYTLNQKFNNYLPLSGGTVTGSLTVSGTATFQNDTFVSGQDNEIVKYRFKTGQDQYGTVTFGKQTSNNGAAIKIEQKEGTPRLYFRASDTAGAIVWQQPESDSQLYFDVDKINFRLKGSGFGYSLDKSSISPLANNVGTLGTSSKQFNAVYGSTLYENGTSLSAKYISKSTTIAGVNLQNNITEDELLDALGFEFTTI